MKGAWSLFAFFAAAVLGYVFGVNGKIWRLLREAREAEKYHSDQAEKLKPKCGMCGAASMSISYPKVGDDEKEIRLCAACLEEAMEYHQTFFGGNEFDDIN